MEISEVQQLTTHTESKAVLWTPELEAALPGIEHAMAGNDAIFNYDRRAYLNRLERSQFVVKTDQGPEVACSLLMNEGEQAEELMIIFAPFADRSPKSSAETMYRYIEDDKTVGKTEAKPNTWNQTTKSVVTTDLLSALSRGMPALTIYAPIPTEAHSKAERELFKDGDFTPSGRLAMEAVRGAVAQAQLRIHGINSPQQFHKLHINGASLGASNAIGAAAKLIQYDFDVKSVTAQELIMSPKSLFDLAKRFTFKGVVGEVSTMPFPEDARSIGEAALRQAIDYKGSELIGMNLRMLQGASKLAYMRGLTKPEHTVQAVESLVDKGVNVLVANAENSSLTNVTHSLLPDEVTKVSITAQEGAKIGHLADEHVALSAIAIALNVTKSAQKA